MTDTRELVERLKVVAHCGTDSTMRHSAYAFMAQDPDGDYVTYSAYVAQAEENRRLRGVLEKIASTGRCEFAAVRAALSSTGENG